MHKKAKLSIDSGSWSGWAGGSSGTDDPTVREVIEQDELIFHFGSNYVLTIISIGENEIVIHSDNLSVQKGSGGINLKPEPQDITLKVGESVRYDTPTMDMGRHWEITLRGIES